MLFPSRLQKSTLFRTATKFAAELKRLRFHHESDFPVAPEDLNSSAGISHCHFHPTSQGTFPGHRINACEKYG